MIKKFIDSFDSHREEIREELVKMNESPMKYPNYDDLFKILCKYLPNVDPERLTVIDHGDYQGTQVFVVGAMGYQPSTYWATAVSYGSCSGCDALQDVMEKKGDERINGLMTLVTHMFQRMKPVCGYFTDEELVDDKDYGPV